MATGTVAAISRPISEHDFHNSIAGDALELSRRRKALAILLVGSDKFLDHQPSTPTERIADWRHACALSALKVMEGTRPPGELAPDCYRHFEGIWLEEIKECLAYYKWVNGSNDWAGPDLCRHYYLMACDDLHKKLVDSRLKWPPKTCQSPLIFLRDAYFDSNGKLAAEKISPLISQKAARLQPLLTDSQKRAKDFVETFYGNIIPAVERASLDATKKVLRAIQHSGSCPGEPGIVNAFEALLLVLFLDSDKVQKCWDAAGEVRRDTTL